MYISTMNCNAELDIPNFSRYTVDYNGVIRSKNYKNTGKKRKLKPALDGSGYLRTMLLNDSGKYETIKVHRIVALTFRGSSELEVNHKDGDKTNNHFFNLEYITHSENMKHAYATGLIKPKKGSLNGNSKLSEEDVKAIREHASNSGRYYGRKDLAVKYGVTECTIKEIVNRRNNSWKHV